MKTSNTNYIRMTDEGSRDAIPLFTHNGHYSVKLRLISLYWVGCSSRWWAVPVRYSSRPP